MNRQLTFIEAINEALHQSMEYDSNVIKYGLGVDDPKSIFGSTVGLKEKFGSDRVFDMPTSENAMTGVAIGAALNGTRSVMVHQRIDFFLLAMDQLVNNAAKWHFMFNKQANVPITIRLILGRGWGQGPTHSQNFHSWFSHIPGLKVVMPSTPYDAKGLLIESIFDNNPVLFIEQRWLHNTIGDVPEEFYKVPLSNAKLLREGNDLTIVSMSILTIESLLAVDFLKNYGISVDLIDLRTINPIDWNEIFKSVKKTGRLLALDNGHGNVSVASEIISKTSINLWHNLKSPPRKLAMPDFPESSSPALTKNYHVRAEDIVSEVAKLMERKINIDEIKSTRKHPHDVPGEWFKGPF
jgi:pyruvate dehydrogenase E1 component beta subunit